MLLLWSLASFTAAQADNPGWTLKQAGEVIGERRVSVCEKGLRIDNGKSGVSIVTAAPEWRVTILNRRSKKYWDIPSQAFRGEWSAKLYSADREHLAKGTWKAGPPTVQLGQKLSFYTMEVPQGRTPTKQGGIWSAKLYTMPAIKIGPQAFCVLSKIYQLPPIKEFPIKLTFVDADDGTVKAVNTYEINSIMLTSNDFQCRPAGYKKARSAGEAFVDPLSQKAFDGFTQWTDPGLDQNPPPAH